MEIVFLYDIPISEKWLDNHKITKTGDVWSCKSKKTIKFRICNGYKCFTVDVYSNGVKTKNFSLHRLMAITFIDNPHNYSIVNHINSVKTDNRIENLEWVTQKENLAKSDKCTSHPRKVNKIKDGQIVETFNTITEAALNIGVCRAAISKVCLHINKTAGGFSWEFEDEKYMHIISLNIEEAKSVYDYDNYYVFKDGSVFSKSRKIFLKPIKNQAGYCYITLSKNKIKKNFYVHCIVADHFIDEKRVDGLQVNHKNKIRDDNRLDNLEIVSCSDNMKHAYS